MGDQQQKKYVPPHLRNKDASSGSYTPSGPGPRGSHSGRTWDALREASSGGFNRQRGSFPRGPGGDYGYNRGGYGGYGGHGGHRGGYGNRGRFPGPVVNELGFHGRLEEDKALEKELFDNPRQSTGINFSKYSEIPIDISGNNTLPAIETFEEKLIGKPLMDNVERSQFTEPTPVQKYSIPIGLANRDLMACAQTGSGKTAGFLFPLIAQMTKNKAVPRPSHLPPSCACPNAVILSPTRELTTQIYDEARKFAYRTGIRTVVVYGGADVIDQLNELRQGVDILVATPGRLVDFIERGRVSMACVKHLVLDEADRMMDMGFEPQITKIISQSDMPPAGYEAGGRQTFMFSATFAEPIQRLASKFLHDYIFLAVGRVGQTASDIEQKLLYVEPSDKTKTLINHLTGLENGLILVFVATKRLADSLEYQLSCNGFPAVSLHGDKSQEEREFALSNFKSGVKPILVATDVASRGLDIGGVTHVFNYDLPTNIDDYVHRIGRTGRVGNTGIAVSFMSDADRTIAQDLYKLFVENNIEIPNFLTSICSYSSRPRGGHRGRGGNRGNFASRDHRDSHSFTSRSSYSNAAPAYQPRPVSSRNLRNDW